MPTTRRSLLKKGVFGGGLLVLSGGLGLGLRRTRLGPPPKATLALFTLEEHSIFQAVAARVVPGEGAGATWPTAVDVDCAGKADAVLARLHPETGREMKQLLRLFDNALVNLVVHGSPTPFTELPPAEQDARLEAWGRSRLSLLRSGYLALTRLSAATYYASTEVHPRIGYPGPPTVPVF